MDPPCPTTPLLPCRAFFILRCRGVTAEKRISRLPGVAAVCTPPSSRTSSESHGASPSRSRIDSFRRKIHPLDKHELAAVVLYHVVAVQAVAAGVEIVRPFQPLVTPDREDRLAHRFGFGAIRVVHREGQDVQRIECPAREVVGVDVIAFEVPLRISARGVVRIRIEIGDRVRAIQRFARQGPGRHRRGRRRAYPLNVHAELA